MKKISLVLTIFLSLTILGCGKDIPPSAPTSGASSSTSVNTPTVELSQYTSENNEPTIPEVTTEYDSEENTNSNKRVVCWGTSLTEGSGGGGVSMPNTLERLSGATVLNYGGYAERTGCIASRSGASKLTLTEDVTIPSSNDVPVEIFFTSEFGGFSRLLNYTDSGLNPVTVCGISGNLSRANGENDDTHFYFTRLEPGDETSVSSDTPIIPFSVNDRRTDDICIFETGGNDDLATTEDILALIEKIDKMIAFSGSDKYLIISELNSHERVPVSDEVNERFEDHYKKHFVNFREYLIKDAFTDLNMPPSEGDLEDISNYEIPRYFRSDDVHGNALYYFLFGQQVYKKCQELGYLN